MVCMKNLLNKAKIVTLLISNKEYLVCVNYVQRKFYQGFYQTFAYTKETQIIVYCNIIIIGMFLSMYYEEN